MLERYLPQSAPVLEGAIGSNTLWSLGKNGVNTLAYELNDEATIMQGLRVRASFVETAFVAVADAVANIALVMFFSIAVIATLASDPSEAIAATKTHITKAGIAIAGGLIIAPCGIISPKYAGLMTLGGLTLLGAVFLREAQQDFEPAYAAVYADVMDHLPEGLAELRQFVDQHLAPERVHTMDDFTAGLTALRAQIGEVMPLINRMGGAGGEGFNPEGFEGMF